MSQEIRSTPPSFHGDHEYPLSWSKIWTTILVDPTRSNFEFIVGDPGANTGEAYIWILISSLIGTFGGLLIQLAIPSSNIPPLIPPILLLIVAPFISLVGFIVVTAIIHFVAKLLGGTGTYSKLAYAFAAYISPLAIITSILAPIPCVNWLNYPLGFFGFVLGIIAIRAVHKFGIIEAFVSFLSQIVLIAFVVIAMLLVLGPVVGNIYTTIVEDIATGGMSSLPEGCPPNCVEANLQDIQLMRANLSGANLSGADLSRAELRGIDLSEADMKGANLFEADLSGADLSRANLSGADLRNANLFHVKLKGTKIDEMTKIDDKGYLAWEIINQGAQGRDLRGASLGGSYLQNVDLERANLSEASLSDINLSGANLRGANLSKVDLFGIDFSKANLKRADLTGASLSGVNFTEADLEGATLNKARLGLAHLSRANLTGANLREVELDHADLSYANLSGADLGNANLFWVNLKGTKIDEMTKIDDKGYLVWEIVNQGAKGRDLSQADLSQTYLRNANLNGAYLFDAELEEADLRGNNNLLGTKLNGANLRQANLIGTNLSKADLDGANLTGAKYNDKTTWPENFDPAKAGAVYAKY